MLPAAVPQAFLMGCGNGCIGYLFLLLDELGEPAGLEAPTHGTSKPGTLRATCSAMLAPSHWERTCCAWRAIW